MKKLNFIAVIAFAMTIMSLTATAQVVGGYRDRQVRELLGRIETRTDSFKREIDLSINRTPISGTSREDRIADFIAAFETSTDTLKRTFDSNRNISSEVNDVLNRALFINRFMSRNRLSTRAQSEWNYLRTDLNSLARIYSVTWDWNRMPEYGPVGGTGGGYGGGYGGGRGGRGFDSRITGTYRLNRTLSDNVDAVLDRSDDSYTTTQRDRMRRNLERRLASPEMMAIEKNGTSVTMASSLSPQVTFDVDGVARTETTNRGRTIRTTASATRDAVEISYVGDRANDFYLTLAPTRDGQLRVTRKLYLENRNQTVSVSSVYDKIAEVAQWSDVNVSSPYPGNETTGTTYGDFFIPNGTRMTAVLNNLVTSKVTQVGDRFTMNVTSPDVYRGATIEGRVAQIDNSGRVSGRANVSLEFENIRMRDGRSYRFAGIIDSVRTVNGDTVSVNNEGTVRENNQTTKTVTRAGIGAALGALIGAIAGGGSGAAIGAAVGAGAGAGTVLIQGRDNVELGQGTEFRITATGPTSNVGSIR
jgi:hypothetical protein